MIRKIYDHEIDQAKAGWHDVMSRDGFATCYRAARFVASEGYEPLFDDKGVVDVAGNLTVRNAVGRIETLKSFVTEMDMLSASESRLPYARYITNGRIELREEPYELLPLDAGTELEILLRFSRGNSLIFANQGLCLSKYLILKLNKPDFPIIENRNVIFTSDTNGMKRKYLLRSYEVPRYAMIM